ncbi:MULTISPECIES: hypothetical protein [Streptomyces]|nr:MULTISPECIES: hypothetical protein [Streptomyces]
MTARRAALYDPANLIQAAVPLDRVQYEVLIDAASNASHLAYHR